MNNTEYYQDFDPVQRDVYVYMDIDRTKFVDDKEACLFVVGIRVEFRYGFEGGGELDLNYYANPHYASSKVDDYLDGIREDPDDETVDYDAAFEDWRYEKYRRVIKSRIREVSFKECYLDNLVLKCTKRGPHCTGNPIDSIVFDDCILKGTLEFDIPNEIRRVEYHMSDTTTVSKVKTPSSLKELRLYNAHNCIINTSMLKACFEWAR